MHLYTISWVVMTGDSNAVVRGSIRCIGGSIDGVYLWSIIEVPAGTILYIIISSGSYVPLI